MAARLWKFKRGSGRAIEGDGKIECPVEEAGDRDLFLDKAKLNEVEEGMC